MQLQPARWDKGKLPASSDDDDDPIHPLSRSSSSPERSDRASFRSLPRRMRLKDKKSAFEFRVIKQASATPSHDSSAASTDKELVPIPSPPWAKSMPLPQGDQPAGGPAGPSSSSNHYFPNASFRSSVLPSRSPEHPSINHRYHDSEGESEIDRDDEREENSRSVNYRLTAKRPAKPYYPPHSSLPPIRCPDSPPPSRSPRPERRFPPTTTRSRRPSPPLYQHPPSQLDPPPPQPMRHRSYHHLPSLTSASPSTGQKRRYASDDERDPLGVRGRRMDVGMNGREAGMNIDKRRKEDLEREKVSRTLPPLPAFRPGHNEHYYSMPPQDIHFTGRPPPPPRPREYTSPPYPHPPPLRYPPPSSDSHLYHPPPSTYRNGPPPLANFPPSYRPPPPQPKSYFPYSHPYPPGSYPPPPRAYKPPPPPRQPSPPLQPLPPKHHPVLPHRNVNVSSPQVNGHSQLLPSSTPHSYFHKIRLNRPKQSRTKRAPSASQQQQQPPHPENQQLGENNQTLYQQAAAARHAAYSSPGTVNSTTLTTHPVPYSIGVKAASSTAGMAGDAGRLVGEYEQHPLRQQTSYLPISAVGGAQFVLKPPRAPKTKPSKLKFMISGPAPTPHPPAPQISDVVQTNGADTGDNFVAGGIGNVVEPRPFQPNPDDVLIEIKQEEECVTASVAAITIAESNEPSGEMAAPDEEDELATPVVEDAGEEMAQGFDDKDVGGNTTALSIGSPPDYLTLETNTFAAPARPSRKLKKYPCDICGHIFTRSGDVRRHQESRHRESAGCICPYCGRILTRQDALQRHWDKYCRKKAKRMDRRRRFGLSFDPGIEVDPVFLRPVPGHLNGDQASPGASSGINIRSFRIIGGDRSTFGGKNKGKQVRARDGDGDVRMMSGSESESEADELESEDPLDGYDSEGRDRRRNGTRRDMRGVGEDEIDELNESSDDERRDGVKSDAEGVSINGDDFYIISGETEEEESEEEDGMDVRPDAGQTTNGNIAKSPPIPESPEQGQPPTPAYHPIAPRLFQSPAIFPSPKSLPPPEATDNIAAKDPTATNNKPQLTNGQSFRQAATISFVEFRPPAPSPAVQNVPSKSRSAPSNSAPMSSFTSTFPAQALHPRQPRARAEYRVRYNAPMLPPPQPMIREHGDIDDCSSLSVHVHLPSSLPAARSRRGPKPRRNDFDAVLDPSQTAAQGGQIRMRVLPQATYTPPVQPALAIMHEQPQVLKRKGKRADGLVPEYGFVPREYVYRERE